MSEYSHGPEVTNQELKSIIRERVFKTRSTSVNSSLIGVPFRSIQATQAPQHVPVLHEESPTLPSNSSLHHFHTSATTTFLGPPLFPPITITTTCSKFPRLVLAPCQSIPPVVVSALSVPTPLPTRTQRLLPSVRPPALFQTT